MTETELDIGRLETKLEKALMAGSEQCRIEYLRRLDIAEAALESLSVVWKELQTSRTEAEQKANSKWRYAKYIVLSGGLILQRILQPGSKFEWTFGMTLLICGSVWTLGDLIQQELAKRDLARLAERHARLFFEWRACGCDEDSFRELRNINDQATALECKSEDTDAWRTAYRETDNRRESLLLAVRRKLLTRAKFGVTGHLWPDRSERWVPPDDDVANS